MGGDGLRGEGGVEMGTKGDEGGVGAHLKGGLYFIWKGNIKFSLTK